MQKSLDSHITPDQWRKAHIAPIFKKGNRQDPANYRPVSLTCIACKLMETFIRDSIMDHLEMNSLLTPKQHGFVRKRSCATQLLHCLEEWTRILDEGDSADIIYLDFSKAFDCVSHTKLIRKMRAFKLNQDVVEWCKSFLSNREQQVIVNGCQSSWASVASGVPQGSVLGPLMFVLFVNDLPDVVDSCIQLFADDVKLYRRIRRVEDQDSLQTDLVHLEEWAEDNSMKSNPNKCQVLHVGQEANPYTYKLCRAFRRPF